MHWLAGPAHSDGIALVAVWTAASIVAAKAWHGPAPLASSPFAHMSTAGMAGATAAARAASYGKV